MQASFPDLYCPFQAATSPHAATAHERSLIWARQFQLLRREEAFRRLSRLQYSLLMARAYPTASLDGLQLVTDWSTWLFLLDDQCDESGLGKNPDLMAHAHTVLLDVFRNVEPPRHAEPLAHALWDLHVRMRRQADAVWLQRFRESVAMYFEANIWEATNRSQGRIPDAVSYCAMRPFTSAVYPCLLLIELTEGLRAPAHIYCHPDIQRLSHMANNVISWSNDLFSYEKERRQGDVHNLVLILSHELGLSLEGAARRVVQLHDSEVHAFVTLSGQLPWFDAAINADLERYLAGLRFWMRGNFDWSLAAARYRPSQTAPLTLVGQPA
jgi:5-epi-alpha-selinene synthase